MQAGQEQERVARVETDGGQASRIEGEVEVAGGERLRSRLVRWYRDVVYVGEPLSLQ